MIPSAPEGANAILRWKNDIYNDFAARMQWTVCSNFKDANHHPVVVMGNNKGLGILELNVKVGQKVVLNAAKSYDPDHNKLTYGWNYYKEPSTYKGDIELNVSQHAACSIIVPKNAANHTIHIILRVVDDGVPVLTSYRRILLKVLPL